MVVQSAEDRQRKNAADSMDGSGSGRVLGQREVCSGTVVVMRVRAQDVTQMTLAEHDHMIKTLASDGADQSWLKMLAAESLILVRGYADGEQNHFERDL